MHAAIANLTFGPEFEVLLPYRFTQSGAAAELSRLIGEYVHPRMEGAPAGAWKVVTDGSVRGRGVHGLEFVGPILSGDTGLASVAKVLAALRQMGATVNSTCGFHVHVGARDQGLDFFKTLVKLYSRYETAIDALMPVSRRGNEASYAKTVSLVSREAIDGARDLTSLGYAIARASGAAAVRYHKVNVLAFDKHKTVEFRQHAGTVDTAKATNWIVTCLRLVATAKAGKTGETGAQIVRAISWDLSRLAGKQAHVATLIARAEGATNEEIRAAYGYATISARKQLRDADLSYYVTRDSRTGKDRFHAIHGSAVTTDTATAAFPTTLDGFADLIEADADQRAFYATRARAAATAARA